MKVIFYFTPFLSIFCEIPSAPKQKRFGNHNRKGKERVKVSLVLGFAFVIYLSGVFFPTEVLASDAQFIGPGGHVYTIGSNSGGGTCMVRNRGGTLGTDIDGSDGSGNRAQANTVTGCTSVEGRGFCVRGTIPLTVTWEPARGQPGAGIAKAGLNQRHRFLRNLTPRAPSSWAGSSRQSPDLN